MLIKSVFALNGPQPGGAKCSFNTKMCSTMVENALISLVDCQLIY